MKMPQMLREVALSGAKLLRYAVSCAKEVALLAPTLKLNLSPPLFVVKDVSQKKEGNAALSVTKLRCRQKRHDMTVMSETDLIFLTCLT